MRYIHVILAVVCVLGGSSPSHCARILAAFQMNANSHFVMYEALLKGLATRGHQVDVLSHYPLKTPIPNYTDLSVKGVMPELENNITFEVLNNLSFTGLSNLFWGHNVLLCETVFSHEQSQTLLQSQVKYDLIITEIFGSDCMMALTHKFKAPIINVVSSVMFPWGNDRTGNPDHPAYIPCYFSDFTSKMTFLQRLGNTFLGFVMRLGNKVLSDRPTYQIWRKHFGDDVPYPSELSKSTSLVLVNSHFSLNQPRPMVPAVVEVAGLHVGTPKKLPQAIEKFLNDSQHGVVYFSLGSLLRVDSLPADQLRAIVEAFAELPERVLIKCDDNSIPNLPRNAMTMSWIPQVDLLHHPKLRVFITHGGLMGTQEAVHAGLPMVGIPVFADQFNNVHNYESKGIAVKLDFKTLTKESFLKAVRSVIDDPIYRENAHRMSRLFRDRPQTPMETAIFWTEYVIRHGGAAHLRSAAVDLPWYQYLLLDVLAVLVLATVSALAVVWLLVRKVLSKLLPRKPAQKLKKK